MTSAMPTVKPSTTGQGMRPTRRPSPSAPAATTTTPAISATAGTTAAPCSETMGSSTTAIAPVGPDTWSPEPPNTAATTPATMAVTSPASGPTPDTRHDAEPQCQRQRDDGDGEARQQVARPAPPQVGVVARRREQPAYREPNPCHAWAPSRTLLAERRSRDR